MLLRLIAFFCVYGFVVSQLFTIKSQPPVSSKVGTIAVLSCSWMHDYASNVTQSVTWGASDDAIMKITRNDTNATIFYLNSPIPKDRVNVTVDWEGRETASGQTMQSSRLIISNVLTTDPQNYTCTVVIDKEQKSITLKMIPYVIPSILMRDIVVEADLLPDYSSNSSGSTESVGTKYISTSCHVRGVYPEPTRFVFTIGGSEKVRMPATVSSWTRTADNRLTGQATLRLEADKKYDKKAVTCSVLIPILPNHLLVRGLSKSTPFRILYEPTFVTVRSPDHVTERENITIVCDWNGNPPPKIEMRSDSPNTNIGEYGSNGLVIANVSRDREGFYWCAALYGNMSNPRSLESARIHLEVRYNDPPVLTTRNLIGVEGEPAEVKCSAVAVPSASVSWRKDNEFYPTDDATLSFASMDFYDAGTYTCHAINEIGMTSSAVAITVESKCDIIFEKPWVAGSQTVANTYLIRLTCSTSGIPECDVGIVPPSDFESVPHAPQYNNGTVILEYPSVPKLYSPINFTCVASNVHTPRYNETVTVDNSTLACCAPPPSGQLSTGAIAAIIILVVVVVIGVPVAFYCIQQKNSSPRQGSSANL